MGRLWITAIRGGLATYEKGNVLFVGTKPWYLLLEKSPRQEKPSAEQKGLQSRAACPNLAQKD